MIRNLEKDTVAILVHIPKDLYDKYVSVLKEKGLKRQMHSTRLLTEAIKKDIRDHE